MFAHVYGLVVRAIKTTRQCQEFPSEKCVHVQSARNLRSKTVKFAAINGIEYAVLLYIIVGIDL